MYNRRLTSICRSADAARPPVPAHDLDALVRVVDRDVVVILRRMWRPRAQAGAQVVPSRSPRSKSARAALTVGIRVADQASSGS
jgi:hypothetical protein